MQIIRQKMMLNRRWREVGYVGTKVGTLTITLFNRRMIPSCVPYTAALTAARVRHYQLNQRCSPWGGTVCQNSLLHKRKIDRMDGRFCGCYNVTFAEQKRAASPHGC